MLPICYICLRSNIKLRAMDEDLEVFYEEQVDYLQENFAQFCGQCIQRLRKFQNFSKRCQLAVKKLKAWRKQKGVKPPIETLYKDLPVIDKHLSMCNKQNFKVFIYHSEDFIQAYPNDTTHSKRPHILMLNITPGDIEEMTRPYSPIQETIKEVDIKIEHMDLDSNINLESTVKNEGTNFEFDVNDSSNENMGSGSDSDESLNNILSKYKDIAKKSTSEIEEQLKKNTKPRKKRTKESFSKEGLKKSLSKKFEQNTLVKDDEGNIFDLDVILYNLNTLPITTLENLSRVFAGPGPFTPLAIRRLVEVRDRFMKYETVFTVKYLREESEMRAEFEKRRQCKDYTNYEIHCDSCLKGFRNKQSLDYHNKKHHNKSMQFSCQWCKMRFKYRYMMKNHLMKHKMMYYCKQCPLITGDRLTMMKHYHHHVGGKIQCKHCGQEFQSKPALYSHYNRFHQPQYICVLCAYASFTAQGLENHRNRKHSDEQFIISNDNRKCETCNVTFISENVFSKHMRRTHGVEIADKKKGAGFKLACILCKKIGSSPGWLVNHFKSEHPNDDMETYYQSKKSFLCDECGKGFSNMRLYKDHKNTHTGVKPFVCAKCPKSFHSRVSLKVHKVRHLPRSHECPHCGKKFATSSNKNNHIRTHFNEKRYFCEICGKAFLFPGNMRQHINGVHLNIRRVRKRDGA